MRLAGPWQASLQSTYQYLFGTAHGLCWASESASEVPSHKLYADTPDRLADGVEFKPNNITSGSPVLKT
jgi:hypothetical protein